MANQSLKELLNSVKNNGILHNSMIRVQEINRELNDFEYIFIEYNKNDKVEFKFVHGININFMKGLHNLINKNCVLHTTVHHKTPIIQECLTSAKTYNTGSDILTVPCDFVVIPPLCIIPEAVTYNGEYVLQTVDHNIFTSEFKQLCQWLIIFLNIKDIIKDKDIWKSKNLWEIMYRKANEILYSNSMWNNIIKSILSNSKLIKNVEACEKFVEIVYTNWYPYLTNGSCQTKYSQALHSLPTDNLSYNSHFAHSIQLLTDLVSNVKDTNETNIDISKLNDFKELPNLSDKNNSVIYFKTIINKLYTSQIILCRIANTVNMFNIPARGKLLEASNTIVKPTNEMFIRLY